MSGDDSTLGTMPLWASVTIGVGLVILALLLIGSIVRWHRRQRELD